MKKKYTASKKVKVASEYSKVARAKDGLESQCKTFRIVFGKKYYSDIRKEKKTAYYKSSVLFPLAVIGYNELLKRHGAVDYKTVARYTRATRINTEKAIEMIEQTKSTE